MHVHADEVGMMVLGFSVRKEHIYELRVIIYECEGLVVSNPVLKNDHYTFSGITFKHKSQYLKFKAMTCEMEHSYEESVFQRLVNYLFN